MQIQESYRKNKIILITYLPISETSRPAKNRRKRKGAAAAAAGGPGGGPMSNKKRSPGPNFSLASQVCK